MLLSLKYIIDEVYLKCGGLLPHINKALILLSSGQHNKTLSQDPHPQQIVLLESDSCSMYNATPPPIIPTINILPSDTRQFDRTFEIPDTNKSDNTSRLASMERELSVGWVSSFIWSNVAPPYMSIPTLKTIVATTPLTFVLSRCHRQHPAHEQPPPPGLATFSLSRQHPAHGQPPSPGLATLPTAVSNLG
ncbi:hypothetical protein J6590_069236 [Homalodisca vitripennis]|nr:hypothetical protein J6590_069236 [Homalodisca vitripennis]